MTYESLKEKIILEVEAHKQELIKINDYLADHPELSSEEYESSKMLVDFLALQGYRTEYPFAGIETAFRGIYGSNNHKYKVALLTEYDALPELGHACGHCLSGAMSVLAGLALKDLQDELNTDIHIIGTPAEEDDGAKCAMTDQGIFDVYDMAIMIHLHNRNLAMPKLQAMGEYFYEFHGKAAHASDAPWEGKNALNALQLMLHAIDMMRQHVKSEAQFHGVIINGGIYPNIVPEKAELHLFVRAGSKKYLEELVSLVDDCAAGAALATQTTWLKNPPEQTYYVDLRKNEEGELAIREVFEELGIEENGNKDIYFGSSDVGNVSYACPAFQPTLQVTDEAVTHTREFEQAMKTDRAHNVLALGAKLMAFDIAKIFNDERRIKRMKEDFLRSRV